ncbi:MAG: alpha-L-rhamnosidase, partial [Planctomycetes bacterium]|nr:alpha-L-rhamnosidase [Planctomycetota bacterium]
MPATRIILADLPFRDHPVSFWQRGVWPASWVGNAAQPAGAGVTAYRLRFTCAERMTARIHVSGDERYELFLDGERIGDGPERGDLRHWLYESWDLDLPAGEHVLVARTWWLGHVGTPTPAAHAQYSVCPAFLLAAEGAAGPL